jgi:predicted transcriptional regulator
MALSSAGSVGSRRTPQRQRSYLFDDSEDDSNNDAGLSQSDVISIASSDSSSVDSRTTSTLNSSASLPSTHHATHTTFSQLTALTVTGSPNAALATQASTSLFSPGRAIPHGVTETKERSSPSRTVVQAHLLPADSLATLSAPLGLGETVPTLKLSSKVSTLSRTNSRTKNNSTDSAPSAKRKSVSGLEKKKKGPTHSSQVLETETAIQSTTSSNKRPSPQPKHPKAKKGKTSTAAAAVTAHRGDTVAAPDATKDEVTQNACGKDADDAAASLTNTSTREEKENVQSVPTQAQPSTVEIPVKGASPSVPVLASSKNKKKKLNFQDQVLQHILLAFKPFSLKSLALELKTTDTALNYVMLSLIDKNLVVTKDFTSAKGRTKTLYWANYGAKAKEVAVSMASQDDMATTKRELTNLQAQYAGLQRNMDGMASELSNEELTANLTAAETELTTLRAKVEAVHTRIRNVRAGPSGGKTSNPLQQQSGPPKSAAQLAKERCPRRLKIRINAMRGEWKARKEKCTDFIDQLADGMEKKPKEVIKLLDLETDEMVGATMPSKKTIED